MTRKRWTKLTMALLAAALLSIVALVMLVDPFEIYHRALFYNPLYKSSTQMYSIPGIAKSYTYDSIIIGSSVTENCTPSVYDEALGGRFVKLSMNAGMARDHAKVMEVAFRTHDVKHVVYGLDMFAYAQYYTNQKAVTPDYLYDADLLNDIQYWFNKSVLMGEIPEALGQIGAPDENMSRDQMYFWEAPYMPTEKELYARVDLSGPMPEQADTARYIELAGLNIEYNLLPYIKAHPETRFSLFFPPYSKLYWAQQARDGSLEGYLAQRQLICEQVIGEPNVALYDFQVETQWTTDLSLYSDFIHYSSAVNDAMATAIAKGQGRVTDVAQVKAGNEMLRQMTAELFDEGAAAAQ